MSTAVAPVGPALREAPATLAPRAAVVLSLLLSAVMASVGLMVLLADDVLPGVAATVGSARGTAYVLAAVDLPLLLGGVALARRGSIVGALLWSGALAYALYNGAVLAIALSFNRLFLLFVALIGLSFWALVSLLVQAPLAERAGTPSARWIGAYLAVASGLFVLLWLKDVVPAVVGGGLPVALQGTGMSTNPVQIVDLSVSLPAGILAGVWLWQRHAWGTVLAATMLVMLTVESVSIAVDQWCAHLADPAAPVATVPAFVAVAVVQVVVTVLLLRRVGEDAAH